MAREGADEDKERLPVLPARYPPERYNGKKERESDNRVSNAFGSCFLLLTRCAFLFFKICKTIDVFVVRGTYGDGGGSGAIQCQTH